MSSPKLKKLQSLKILQSIKTGSTDPESLLPGERRALVTILTAEGQSTAEIAHFLKVSDRTIERENTLFHLRF